jgi:hypothetical protein
MRKPATLSLDKVCSLEYLSSFGTLHQKQIVVVLSSSIEKARLDLELYRMQLPSPHLLPAKVVLPEGNQQQANNIGDRSHLVLSQCP